MNIEASPYFAPVIATIITAMIAFFTWLVTSHFSVKNRITKVEQQINDHETHCNARWDQQQNTTQHVANVLDRIETKIDVTKAQLDQHIEDEDQKQDLMIDLIKRNGQKG